MTPARKQDGWQHQAAQATQARLSRSSGRSQHTLAIIAVLVTDLQPELKLHPTIETIGGAVKQVV